MKRIFIIAAFFMTFLGGSFTPAQEPRQDLQVTAGANLYFGGTDTEFGGIDLPGTRFTEAPADNVYLWLSFFY